MAPRLLPSSPPRPTKLGLGALPGPLLGLESWQQRQQLQDEETGSSPHMPDGGWLPGPELSSSPLHGRPCSLRPMAQKQAS